MMPSTITPTGKPHNRGLLVQLQDGQKGRTFFQRLFVEEKVAVYLETAQDVYGDQATLYTRDKLKVIGYID